jgi:hypothetical protein|tara:strand:- start:4320 stop:6413 length:2094 start_codon:yes stop_codon:yes gene_type:complete
MAIKRFTATADTTITNAFLEGLSTRATGSNIGLSDSLEVFSIYGQSSSSLNGLTSELSRVLVKFPVTTSDDSVNSIQAKRAAGSIPASGSVSFYFRLHNVAHHETLPVNAKYNIFAVSSSWEEGRGMDLDTYADKTFDGVGSNWINANGNHAAATLASAINVAGVAQNDKFTMTVPTSAGGDGVTYTFLFDSGTDVEADEGANTFGISLTSVADDADCAAVLVKAINGTADNKYKYGAANLGAGSNLAPGTIGLTAAITAGETTKITLTMDDIGVKGNVAGVLTAVTNFGGDKILESSFTGGDGYWATVGGDYHTGPSNAEFMYSQTLESGTEDIEVDISGLVEQWIAGAYSNYGLGIFLTSSQEAYFNSSTGVNLTAANGGAIHNTVGATTSFHTKKFSARGSEYFFNRPTIEARWDSAIKDDRGNLYYSSSLQTAEENMNTIYFYNYFRGNLRNIPGIGTNVEVGKKILVSLFSGSSADTAPFGSALQLVVDGDAVTHADRSTVITGSYVSTGIYSASFALDAASPPIKTIYDVWFSGSDSVADATTATQYHTGTIKPKVLYGSAIAPDTRYITNINNLRSVYRNDETSRFRLYTRHKNWSPTIYTKAVASPEVDIIESGSYEVYRVIDDFKVIPYGTGSDLHTQMSFDASGSYFDLDMSLLESGYMYGLRFVHYNQDIGSWVEQPETFKFRVED